MNLKFETVIQHLIGSKPGEEPIGKINVPEQFTQAVDHDLSIARNLNAAFLIQLSGESHPFYTKARDHMDSLAQHPSWKDTVSFYRDGINRIHAEMAERTSIDPSFAEALNQLYSSLTSPTEEEVKEPDNMTENFWRLFFPEGISGLHDWKPEVEQLRKKRRVRITHLNPKPITRPLEEVLFTSNILLTIPPASRPVAKLDVKDSIRADLGQVIREQQLYWYDHPIPIGVEPEHNEVIYGLRGLSEALKFEKQRGVVDKDAKLTCVLTASVTHKGLQAIAREYLEEALKKAKEIQEIDAFVFTEIDARRLIDEIILPAARKYTAHQDPSILNKVVGIDGEYGRHYTFLKAISAFWKVFINPGTKATFKIDLDQVFPQKELVDETGASALEHLKTPLWGATGIDNQGNKVELGMLAGALVNQKDIHRGLFTPDVVSPENSPRGDEMIFFSKVPQALSTEAEMMTRYDGDPLNGREQCVQRIHVTGGTNGILVSSLRKHRPFTPTFIGRAEDQAYLLSVLFQERDGFLRYVHQDGLIMRHDKESMAGEAIQSAALGKLIGDYIRILSFSFYARLLPWSFEDIKKALDPFTGCFISRIPVTVVYLRAALKVAAIFSKETRRSDLEGLEFVKMAVSRLQPVVTDLAGNPKSLEELYQREKEAWDLFYDVLDSIERGLETGDSFSLELQKKARALVEDCKIRI